MAEQKPYRDVWRRFLESSPQSSAAPKSAVIFQTANLKAKRTRSMRKALIVAMSQNRVIGRNNKLPWYLPGDLRYFKQATICLLYTSPSPRD